MGAVNVPTTYPPSELNGLMVAGPNSDSTDFVSPAERERDVLDAGYVNMDSGHRLALKSGGDKAVETAKDVIGSRFRLTRTLLEEESYDFFFLGIFCIDTIQHYYWDGPELEATYRFIDRELGDLLDQLEGDGREWNVVVVSDHGFRPIKGAFNLDTFLERRGFLKRGEETDETSSLKRSLGLTTENALKIVNSLGLERAVSRLPDALVRRAASGLTAEDSISVVDSVDWGRSSAVFLHGGIYVLDGVDREPVVRELEEELRGVRDPEGEPVFTEIHRAEEVYDGEYVDRAPDLIPISNDYKLLGFSRSGDLFRRGDDWVAGHERDGLFLAEGPDFAEETGAHISIHDVSPTLLHLLGTGVPSDIDGRVRRELLKGDAREEDVEYIEPIEDGSDEAEVSDDDHERIEERLQDLGYVE